MILESMDGSANLNIKDLTIESPKPPEQPLFDPEVLRSVTEVAVLKSNDYKIRKRWSPFLYIASTVKILHEEQCPDLGVDEEAYGGILGYLNDIKDQGLWRELYENTIDWLVLFPERKADFELSPEAFEMVLQAPGLFLGIPTMTEVYDLILQSKLLFPKREFDFRAVIKPNSVDLISRILFDIKDAREIHDWEDLAAFGMFLRLLYPDLFPQIDPLTKYELSELVKYVGPNSIHHFKNVKILLAHEAKITENGLEITMNEPKPEYLEKPLELPVRRMF